MDSYLLLLPVLLPIAGGLLLSLFDRSSRRGRQLFIAVTVIVNTLVVFWLILCYRGEAFTLFKLAKGIEVTFRFDGFGRLFAGMVALLWPLATFFAFGYMEENVHRTSFYEFFVIAYGVTIGIAISENLPTMYCFYEFLTLTTVPLVLHYMDKGSVRAGRKYLLYSIGGAALALVGMAILLNAAQPLDFVLGGLVSASDGNGAMYLELFFIMFLGFSVKAAVFPFYRWLPVSSVAPTPVTAILHAVAVVTSGVFALIRLVWFVFKREFIFGSWAWYVCMALVIFTMLYGSVMAVKRGHWKLKMVYSTSANLSYMLFGVMLMTPEGLAAGLQHMLFHSLMKMTAFFCVGAVLCGTERELVDELEGLGRKMPKTFACYAVAAMAMTGIPPFNGFVSKYNLLAAAAAADTPMAWIGAAVLMVSAILTAIYMFVPLQRAFFPRKDRSIDSLEDVKEARNSMLIPAAILAALCILTGLFAQPVITLTENIAAGLF